MPAEINKMIIFCKLSSARPPPVLSTSDVSGALSGESTSQDLTASCVSLFTVPSKHINLVSVYKCSQLWALRAISRQL